MACVVSARTLLFLIHGLIPRTACTAVVTELAYHKKNTIDADISFLSEPEWRQELGVLLQDLVDEDGNVKRTIDLKSDAGVAWQKVEHSHTISQKWTDLNIG